MNYVDSVKQKATEICEATKADVEVQGTAHKMIELLATHGRCSRMSPNTFAAVAVQVSGLICQKFISNQVICNNYQREVTKTTTFRGRKEVMKKKVYLDARTLTKNVGTVFELLSHVNSNGAIIDLKKLRELIRT